MARMLAGQFFPTKESRLKRELQDILQAFYPVGKHLSSGSSAARRLCEPCLLRERGEGLHSPPLYMIMGTHAPTSFWLTSSTNEATQRAASITKFISASSFPLCSSLHKQGKMILGGQEEKDLSGDAFPWRKLSFWKQSSVLFLVVPLSFLS